MENTKIDDNSNLILGNILNSNFFKHQRIQNDFHNKWTDEKYWLWLIEKYDFFLNDTLKKEIIPRKIHQIWLGSSVPKNTMTGGKAGIYTIQTLNIFLG